MTGLVVRGTMNEYLASKSFLRTNIASPFAAEAYAGLEAVKLGIEMGFQEIQILGRFINSNKEMPVNHNRLFSYWSNNQRHSGQEIVLPEDRVQAHPENGKHERSQYCEGYIEEK